MINQEIAKQIKSNWDSLLKPLDSLGTFEELAIQIGSILNDPDISVEKKALVVFCSDNGIIEENVSQSNEKVTLDVARLLGSGKSSVCHMAKQAGVLVFPFNLGIKLRENPNGVDDRFFISNGTKDFLKSPAMSQKEFDKAYLAGATIAKELFESGYRMILLGEMGIGNTTTSTAVIASALDIKVSEICGRGSGLSDDDFEHKIEVISRSIDKYDLRNKSIKEILCSVGGYDIVAMTGLIVEAEKIGIPVVLDGLITAAAAISAYKINPDTCDYVIFSHKGREQGIMSVANYLKKRPVIDANLALGEGTGAVLFVSLFETALSVYRGNTRFTDISMEAYRRF